MSENKGNKFDEYMKSVNLVRAGLTFIALMVFALFVPKLIMQGDVAFGKYFFMMLFGVVLFGALVVWDIKTAGRQAWIVVLAAIALTLIGANFFRGLDSAGMDEFIASLRAVALVVIAVAVSFALHYTATSKSKPAETSAEQTLTRAQATEAPATL